MSCSKLRELAAVIRSKNAGPFELTLDIIFESEEEYIRVRDANALTKEQIARLYGTTERRVLAVVPVDNALAIKITLVRPCVSGAIGDSDVYGAQQHAPLLDIEIP